MGKQIIAIVVLVALVFIFIGLYLLNKKTPVPEGCENLNADCIGCPIHSCLKNVAKKEEK